MYISRLLRQDCSKIWDMASWDPRLMCIAVLTSFRILWFNLSCSQWIFISLVLLCCIALYTYSPPINFSILLEVPIFYSACMFFLSVSQYITASRKDSTQITHLKFTQAIKKNGNDNLNCMQKLYLSTCTSLTAVAAVHIGRSMEQISWCVWVLYLIENRETDNRKVTFWYAVCP